MKRKINLNFKDIHDSDLNMLAFRVAERMTNNEYFPDPGFLVIELNELCPQFNKAVAHVGSRDMEKIAHKNNLRALLIKKLKEVGDFVIKEAKGAELPLISSGFPLIKPVDEIILGSPEDFIIMPGPKPGEIIMKVSRVRGARSYLYQWTPAPLTNESVWESIADTRCKKVISKLPLGVNYFFRMAAIGSRNQIIYTKPLSRYVS
jgi:hypothetical protein